LTDEHSYQPDKAEEWWRGRRQFDQAKNNTDGETGTEGEQHRPGRDGLSIHSGILATLLPLFLPR
jgi:hypothetical protein